MNRRTPCLVPFDHITWPGRRLPRPASTETVSRWRSGTSVARQSPPWETLRIRAGARPPGAETRACQSTAQRGSRRRSAQPGISTQASALTQGQWPLATSASMEMTLVSCSARVVLSATACEERVRSRAPRHSLRSRQAPASTSTCTPPRTDWRRGSRQNARVIVRALSSRETTSCRSPSTAAGRLDPISLSSSAIVEWASGGRYASRTSASLSVPAARRLTRLPTALTR